MPNDRAQAILRKLLTLTALGLLQPLVVCGGDDVPAWLRELTNVSLAAHPAKVSSIVLFNEEHTTAADSGRLTTITRTAIKILARQGVDPVFFDQYDSKSGKVRDFRAWMIPPAGKVKKYGKDEILDVACVDNDAYNECRRRMVSGKRDAEAGAVFGYESSIEYESFSNQLLFHFQESAPVRLARFLVTVPAGWELKSASFNGAPREPVRSGDTYLWQMENLAALEREPSSPGPLTLAPWVGVSLLGPQGRHPVVNWAGAARLLAELNEGQSEPSEAMAAKARSLVEGAKTELDKIRAIGHFAQQLNYVSIQMNVSKGGGYRPHLAAQTYEKLYGDCKDKANLTRAMLKAVGITAYPVAIYAGDRTHVNEDWPSLGAFNHAISAIRVGPDTQARAVLEHPRLGRLLFFDPTDPYVSAGYLPQHEQASLALVGASEGGELLRVPVGLAVAAEHDRRVEAVLGADGSITGRFVDRRTGEQLSEAISKYRALPKDEYVKMIERWVGRSVPGATTTGVEVSEGGGELVLTGEFTSRRFAQTPQPRMLIFKAGLLSYGDLRFNEKTRKYPVVLDADALHETVRIMLPDGYKVDELPTAVRMDAPFGKYTATWVSENGAIVFLRDFEMRAQTVPTAQYAELKHFLDAMAGSAESAVVLMK